MFYIFAEMATNFASSRDSASPAQKVQYFHDTKDKDQTKEASTDKENNKSLVHPNSKLEVCNKLIPQTKSFTHTSKSIINAKQFSEYFFG